MPLFPRALVVLAGCCACALLVLLPPAAHGQGGPVTHPQGEWYDAGYQMAQEARSSFHILGVPDEETVQRLTRLLRGMGIKASEHKTSDIALLQQGWEDGIMGRAEAMIYPPDQQRSILPARLRGFHEFPADLEDQRLAAERARKAAEEAKKPKSLAEMAALWKNAVVKVKVRTSDSGGHGSGFFIGPGLLMTNWHVIDDAVAIEVMLEADGSVHKGTLVASAEVPDVALVRIAWQGNVTMPLGNADLCHELDEVVIIGYPKFEGLSATFVKGSISAARRLFPNHGHEYDCLQMDIRTYGGNSGGPVISTKTGTVVGLHTFGFSDARLAQFTMSQRINFLLPFLRQYAKGQYKYFAE